MEQYHLKFLPPLLILLICISCSNLNQSGPEPNDTILQAGTVQYDKPHKMTIDSADDRDWFYVPVPDKGYVHIGTKNVPQQIDPEIRFADKQPWKDQKQEWFTGRHSLPKAVQIHKKDTIYFVIHDNNENNRSSEKFAIKTTFHKEFDPHELNNKAKQAQQAKLGQPLQAFIYPVGDRDWFTFQADSAGYLWAKQKWSPKDVDPEVRFAKTKPMQEKVEYISGNCSFPCAIRIKEKGKYYVNFHDNNHNGLAKDSIRWKVDYLAEMDTTEPNGKTGQAQSISVPATLSVAIFPKGDNEYFKLTPEQDRDIVIQAKPAGDIDPEVKLYRKKELNVKRQTGWQSVPTKLSLTKGDTYFINLQDNNNNHSNPQPFQVMLSKEQGS